MKKQLSKISSKILLILLTLFLYAPIFYVIFFSFNSSKSLSKFSGFSLRWYHQLLESNGALKSLEITIIVAILATIISVVIGTLASIGLSQSKKIIKKLVTQINNLPILNPEIVTAVGLMLFFTSMHIEKGFITLLLSHIAFCIPYVMLSVMPRVRQLDQNLADAAMDLGATPFQALLKVIVPEILPGIIAGGLIAFTMSFDDFIISYFVSGNGVSNVSIFVYTMSKRINPLINAISSVTIFGLTIALIIYNILSFRKSKGKKNGKIVVVIFLVVSMMLFGLNRMVNNTKNNFDPIKKFGSDTLNVFNWGEYIDPKTIDEFEKKYNVKVNYTLYGSNEEMYTKLLGGESFDVIYPSDYMCERLIKENKLAKINHNHVPNIKYVSNNVRNLKYDKNLDYGIPYFSGSVGILYNNKKISEKEIQEQGYNIFLNKKYKNRVYFYDSERDSFMVALKALGYSMNTNNYKEINKAYDWLASMKKAVNPVFVTDEVIDGMINGEKDLAIVYSGDANYIINENKNMSYYEPTNGTNVWVDEMVIPKNSKHKRLAEEWINFNLNKKIAEQNSKYVGYTSSVTSVREKLFKNSNAYHYRDDGAYDEIFQYNPKIKKYMSEKWVKIKALK